MANSNKRNYTLDIVKGIVEKKTNIYQVRPQNFEENTGANMPIDGLMPAFLDSDEDFKPEKLNAFWSKDLIIKWLKDGKNNFDFI